jgi:hypothetical protein
MKRLSGRLRMVSIFSAWRPFCRAFTRSVYRLPIRLCVARQARSRVGFPDIHRTSPQHNSLVRDPLVAVWGFFGTGSPLPLKSRSLASFLACSSNGLSKNSKALVDARFDGLLVSIRRS